MKISRIASAIFLLAIVAAGAAGCSLGRDMTSDSGKAAEGRSAADGVKEGRVKITVSVWDNANSPQFQAMADAFMEKPFAGIILGIRTASAVQSSLLPRGKRKRYLHSFL